MKLSATVSATLVGLWLSFTGAQDDKYICEICGDGMIATKLDADASVPTQPVRSCQMYHDFGLLGEIPEKDCAPLREFLIVPCGCEPEVQLLPGQALDDQGNVCYNDFNAIDATEDNVTDFTTFREYILCPGTEFKMAFQDDDGSFGEGQMPLFLRPNIHVKCGQDGKSSNNCLLTEGSYHVVLSDLGLSIPFHNITIEGFTLDSAFEAGIVLSFPAQVVFKDCIIQNMANFAPVLGAIIPSAESTEAPVVTSPPVETEGVGNRRLATKSKRIREFVMTTIKESHNVRSLQEDEPVPENSTVADGDGDVPAFVQHPKDSMLFVTFKDVSFIDNMGVKQEEFVRPGIVTLSEVVSGVFDNCQFTGNDYSAEVTSFIYGWAINADGPLNVTNSCFTDNKFEAHVIRVNLNGVYNFTSTNSFIDEHDVRCEVELFPTVESLESDSGSMCLELENQADVCSRVTDAPTTAPAASPIETPSTAPAVSPVKGPTSGGVPASTFTFAVFVSSVVLALFV